MNFHRYLAKQLKNPSGIMGRFFLASMWNKRNRALNDFTLRQATFQPNDHVLEVGFGGGYLLNQIANILNSGLIVGIDISRTMMIRYKKQLKTQIQKDRLEILQGKAEFLPFPSKTFMKILSVNSLFYWDKPKLALQEFYRILKNDGLFLLTLTAKESLENRKFMKHGISNYDTIEIIDLLKSIGFCNIQSKYQSDKYRKFYCLMCYKSQSDA